MRLQAFFFLLLPLLLLLSGCEKQEAPVRQALKVQLKWVHQAQFAGFYMAQEEGYYAEEHLDVTLVEGGLEIQQVDRLLSGAADFAVVPAEALLLKNPGTPKMVAIAVLYQRNPTVFIAKSESGIMSPKDLAGKTVAVGKMENSAFIEGIIHLKAMLKNTGVDFNSITTADYDPTYAAFLQGTVDVTPSYLTGGVTRLQNQGHQLSIIWPGDYGVDAYADTLATTDAYIAAHPDVVLRFLRATLKGWQKTIEDHDLALTTTMKYARVQGAEIQEAMLDAQVPLVSTGTTPIGWMKKFTWHSMAQLYTNSDAKESTLAADTFYTTSFLETIYGQQPE